MLKNWGNKIIVKKGWWNIYINKKKIIILNIVYLLCLSIIILLLLLENFHPFPSYPKKEERKKKNERYQRNQPKHKLSQCDHDVVLIVMMFSTETHLFVKFLKPLKN